MTSFYRTDQKIIDLLKKSPFTISAEVIPPRNGAEQKTITNQISALVSSGAMFLSVTKGAGGSLRGGSLPIAQVIKEQFSVPSIAHFTCRDLTPAEVENQLIDHALFGIRNILALRGDPPEGEGQWQAKPGSWNYAWQLIAQISNLNKGIYIERPGFKIANPTPTDFCIGAAAYPDDPTHEARTGFLKIKVENGAEYAITQMLFSTESYARYLDECAKEKIFIPILPGARVLTSKKQAGRMAKRFAIKVDDDIMAALPEDENSPGAQEKAIEVFDYLIEKLIKVGAPGMHIFVLTDTELSCRALQFLKSKYDSRNK